MAKFIFPLETVLRHRERIEQDRQRDVAVAQLAKTEAHNEIVALDEKVRAALADLRANHLVGEINLSFLAAHRRFMLAMQRQGLVLIQRLQEKQNLLRIAQTALLEASKQKKILEKLKERQEGRWKEGIARKDLAAADELATQMTYAANLADQEQEAMR